MKSFIFTAFGCANPPLPDENLHLSLLNYTEGQIIDFNQSVAFGCESGKLLVLYIKKLRAYSITENLLGYFFDDNKERSFFTLECSQEIGTWENITDGMFCVHPEGVKYWTANKNMPKILV